MPGLSSTTVGSGRPPGAMYLQHVEQGGRVVVGGAHVVLLEDLREDALEHLAVLQHVADARRRAAVVLQDEVAAVGVADQVGAADVDVDVARHRRAHELAAEERALVDQARVDDAVAEDELVVVDVLEEQVQRGEALHQAPARCAPTPRRG